MSNETDSKAVAIRQDDAAVTIDLSSAIERVVVMGDVSALSPAERVAYYKNLAISIGVDWIARPFDYIEVDAKGGGKRLVLYPNQNCASQLRDARSVSCRILSREKMGDIYIVTATATLPSGRCEEATGAVPIAVEEGEWRTNEKSGKRYFVGNGKFKELRGNDLANALMKAECVPTDSEILTRDGFKTHDRLTVGESVLAYDPESGECRWTALEGIAVYPSTGVSRFHTTEGRFDMTCTPDHSWVIQSSPYSPDTRGNGSRGPRGPYQTRQSDRRLVKAREIKAGQSIILAAPETETSDSLLRPVEAAVLGWAVTDGTIKRVGNYVRIGICQSKDENFEVIRETVEAVVPGARESVSPGLRRTFPSSGRTYDTKEQHWWYIPAAVTRAILERAGYHDRRDLPRIVTHLSSEARRAMLQAMMLAEGDKRQVFANGDRWVLDAFDILCALQGYATGRLAAKDTVFTKRLKKTCRVAGSNLQMEDAGIVDVWCPTTQYGTWIMRQAGQVTITGNTKAKRRATFALCGLGAMADEPEGRHVEVETRTGEVALPDPRDQVPLTVPKAASKRFHTRPDDADPADADVIAVIAEPIEPEDAPEDDPRDAVAAPPMPNSPAEIVAWYNARVAALPPKIWEAAEKHMQHARDVAIAIKAAGISDQKRRNIYACLTGHESGKDMTQQQVTAMGEAASEPQKLLALASWWEKRNSETPGVGG